MLPVSGPGVPAAWRSGRLALCHSHWLWASGRRRRAARPTGRCPVAYVRPLLQPVADSGLTAEC